MLTSKIFFFHGVTRKLKLFISCFCLLLLSACIQLSVPFPPLSTSPTQTHVMPVAQNQNPSVIGNGRVPVALLLPKTGIGEAPHVAQAFENAARMALDDFAQADIRLLIKDTAGTVEGGRIATEKALADNVQFILGPVFSPAVSGASSLSQPSHVPMIAFSSDSSVARPGVYLLSFLPQEDIRRIISYAAARQNTAMAALLPDTAYGAVVEASLRGFISASGGRLVALARYRMRGSTPDPQTLQEGVVKIAAMSSALDAVIIPDRKSIVGHAVDLFVKNGVSKEKIAFLGSGQWGDTTTRTPPSLLGGTYPAPTTTGFTTFARRYKARFGAPPPRNATLVYDAVILVAGLVQTYPRTPFSPQILTNANGFSGIDGIFRFKKNGLNTRGLAVYEMTGSGARVLSPAPLSFVGS